MPESEIRKKLAAFGWDDTEENRHRLEMLVRVAKAFYQLSEDERKEYMEYLDATLVLMGK